MTTEIKDRNFDCGIYLERPLDNTEQMGREFDDISSEEWREYLFPGGDLVRIDSPLKIHISDRGHRILDASANSYFIPVGWIQLKWKAKEGEPHFVI